MLTVRALLDELGLELSAGDAGADAPVRWVHISELADPTPWLSGGELLLTTGIQLDSPERQREFVHRLADHHLAGLGLGTGFDHDRMPAALVEEAEAIGFPLFAVPYETPFIAITETAFTRLVNEQYEVLQRSIGIHKRLERLVLEERGLDEVVAGLTAAIGGAVLVLDSRGEQLASRVFRREVPAGALEAVREQVRIRASDGREFAPDDSELAGRALVLPVSPRATGEPQAWLVAARDTGGLSDFERLLLQQATTVVALELMRQRAMRDTERRLAGDVLAEAVSGQLEEHEVAARVRPFGIGAEAAVMVFTLPDGEREAEVELDRMLADHGRPALVATSGPLLCAVVDGSDGLDPVELAGQARDELKSKGLSRAAASRVAPTGVLRRSFHEARLALEAAGMANGTGTDVASHRDLGAFHLLLSVQDDEALRFFCDSVLGPIEEGGGEYGDELIRSLEAFIEQNGQWERAARELYCHRHTLRYRIRRVEELTGRDLSNARDRIEFWLALRARELVA